MQFLSETPINKHLHNRIIAQLQTKSSLSLQLISQKVLP